MPARLGAHLIAMSIWRRPISKLGHRSRLVALVLAVLPVLIAAAPIQAQERVAVQEMTGLLEPEDARFYTLQDLKKGDTVYVYARNESGNLDPFVALPDVFYDKNTLRDDYLAEIDRAIEEGQDPLVAVPEFADRLFLAWDDDGGLGHDASMEFQVPKDGDYQLLVTNAAASGTFGDYNLLIGLNEPSVAEGEGEPTGETIAVFDKQASEDGRSVQEVTGNITAQKESTFYFLEPIEEGDTLYVYAEAVSGDLRPTIVLSDYSRKPLRTGNFNCGDTTATLQYELDEDGRGLELEVSGCPDGEDSTTGSYRLRVGVNAPEVLTGDVAVEGQPVVKQPIEVQVGLQMDQITNVDEVSENFAIVGNLQMEYDDPALAFDPSECRCRVKLFRDDDFVDFVAERDIIWPAFVFFNQQDRRWSQNRLVAVEVDGHALYFERFTATLQAPDFDFRSFPFDEQVFYIRIDLLIPEERFVYSELEGFSAVGEQLGEEEWVVTSFDVEIDSQQFGSRFNFAFTAKRVIGYYVTRILVPLLLIIMVSWVAFFLNDYVKRIEVTGGNLLLFIAFNFAIAGDLPRLGYMTFMDVLLMSTFAISVLIVAFNVLLRRLEIHEKGALAEILDRYTLWIIPIIYAVAYGSIAAIFL